jgi:glycosyltransferase involved in cell wall biosynthesis
MKICILQTLLPSKSVRSGGEERFTLGLAENLSKRHEVVVLTKGDESKDVVRGNLTIRYVKCIKTRYLRFLYYFLKLVWGVLKVRDIDIIQAHISDGSNGLAGIVASKIRGKPLITRVSGFDPVPELGFFRRRILTTIFKHSDLIISINSNFMVDEIKKLWEKSSIAVMPHGINMDGKLRPKRFPGAGRKELLFVGRLVWFKNVDMLLRAMKIALKAADVRLTIIGTGPKERELKEIAAQLQLGKSVVFKGEMSHERVIDHMKKSDLFVFPSKNEPRGLVLIEAMLAGLPIIAVNRGGPKDIVKDGRNGYLVGPEDHEGMAGKITALLKDKKAYERMSRNNVEDVKRYGWEKVVKMWEGIYAKVLKSR